jgi:FemAB-related protein (PEP-CTERM system-associated)
MAVTCRELDAAAAPAWDRFVQAHPQATFFHLAAWADVLRHAFGQTPRFLLAEQDGAICGVLPLVHMRSLLFGNTLVSTPFCVYGGPLVGDAEIAEALLRRAAELLASSRATALELRLLDQPESLLGGGWVGRDDLYVTFRRPIAASDDANLKAIPRKQRAMVRKGIEAGLTDQADHDVDRLHGIYAESVRNLGTPVFPRRYFRLLRERFADALDVVTVRDPGGAAIASVLNFYWRDTVLPYYGGGTAAARAAHANDFMYWAVMRRAAARGCRLFDFGRSKIGTGAFAFKRNWGFEPMPLRLRYRLRPGHAIPDHNPLNPKYRLFIAGWKRLPLAVANRLGPFVVRGTG